MCERGHLVEEPPDLQSDLREPCGHVGWSDVRPCGSLARNIVIDLPGVVEVGTGGEIVRVREWTERHALRLTLSSTLPIAGAVLGHLMAGWWGLAFGILVGFVSQLIGLRAWTSVRELDHGEP